MPPAALCACVRPGTRLGRNSGKVLLALRAASDTVTSADVPLAELDRLASAALSSTVACDRPRRHTAAALLSLPVRPILTVTRPSRLHTPSISSRLPLKLTFVIVGAARTLPPAPGASAGTGPTAVGAASAAGAISAAPASNGAHARKAARAGSMSLLSHGARQEGSRASECRGRVRGRVATLGMKRRHLAGGRHLP